MDIVNKLMRGTSSVIPQEEFAEKIRSGKKLKIKFGCDPTSPGLHLGHAVVLSKLREFQDCGHEIIFLIGDFTARIGDPSGKSKTRPALSREEIEQNAKTYFDQVGLILDTNKITIRYNSEWLDKLTGTRWLELCAKVTLAQIIEREDFAKRLANHQPIGFHELLYPIMQGYDSVALHADIELGGNDQTFNLLMGRCLQEHFNQEPQAIMTLPLLPGLDGVEKMSKSLGNTIALTEEPDQVYGKLMSISDDLMWTYYAILLCKSAEEVAQFKADVAAGSAHPMALKKALAHAVVEKFWGKSQADAAQLTFENLFQQRDLEYAQSVSFEKLGIVEGESAGIMDLLKKLVAVESSGEARRLIQAGAVSVDGSKITDITKTMEVKKNSVIKVGKHRFYKIT